MIEREANGMAEHVSTHGLWYAEHGEGDPLVLLHPGGAGVDSRPLEPQVSAFARRFHVYPNGVPPCVWIASQSERSYHGAESDCR